MWVNTPSGGFFECRRASLCSLIHQLLRKRGIIMWNLLLLVVARMAEPLQLNKGIWRDV